MTPSSHSVHTTVRRYEVLMKHADLHVVEADLVKVRKEGGGGGLGRVWMRVMGERENQNHQRLLTDVLSSII